MSSTTLRFLQQENARMQEENKILRQENLRLRRYINSLKSLAWATQQITSEENLLVLIDQILDSAMDVLNAESGSLLLLDEETDELAFVLVHGDVEEELKGYRIKRDEGIAGWAATRYEPLVVNNPRQDPRFHVTVDETFDFFSCRNKSVLYQIFSKFFVRDFIQRPPEQFGGVSFHPFCEVVFFLNHFLIKETQIYVIK